MLLPNLEPGGRLSSCTLSNSQRSPWTDIAPFVAMFDPIRKPKIFWGFQSYPQLWIILFVTYSFFCSKKPMC